MRGLLPAGTLLRNTYRIEAAIARGASGITYRGRHVTLAHDVAIKEFFPHGIVTRQGDAASIATHGATDSATAPLLTREPGGSQPEGDRARGRDRLLRVHPDVVDVFQRGLRDFVERSRAIAPLRHPNMAAVQDLLTEHGTAYVVSELVGAPSVRDLLACGDAAVTSARSSLLVDCHALVEQLVAGCEAVHALGLPHLGVRPENVLLGEGGRVVLVGTGVSKIGCIDFAAPDCSAACVAPEVLLGSGVGPETDVYAISALAYELLTRRALPSARERLLGTAEIDFHSLEDPWRSLLESGLRLRRSDRPSEVVAWWRGRWGKAGDGAAASADKHAPAVAREVLSLASSHVGDGAAASAETHAPPVAREASACEAADVERLSAAHGESHGDTGELGNNLGVGVTIEGRGEFASLHAALGAVQDGDVIRLAPGLHRLTFPRVLERDIHLLGGGPELCTVALGGRGSLSDDPNDPDPASLAGWLAFRGQGDSLVLGVRFRADELAPARGADASVLPDRTGAQVSLPQLDGRQATLLSGGSIGAQRTLVELFSGRCTFENCVFEGASGDGRGGLVARGCSEVVATSCAASGNFFGFIAVEQANLTVQDCTAHDNRAAGLAWFDDTSGLASHDRAYANGVCGIMVGGQAQPVLEGNRLEENVQAGLTYVEHASGNAWYNECRANGEHGIVVGGEARPTLDSNQCEENWGSGIACVDESVVTAVRNECRANHGCGILVDDNARVLVEENACGSNAESGLCFAGGASGQCRSNESTANDSHGVHVQDSALVKCTSNRVHDNAQDGIVFEGDATGLVAHNSLSANGENGIRVADGARPALEGNEVRKHSRAGLFVGGRSRATAQENSFVGNLYGIYVDEAAEPTVFSNRCLENRASGIAFFGRSGGTARENELRGNVHGVYVDEEATPVLERNQVVANQENGIVWFGQARGQATANEVAENLEAGLGVYDSASPDVRNNRFYNNRASGICCAGNSEAVIVDNQLLGNKQHGLEVSGSAHPRVERNHAHGNAGNGMIWTDLASGRVEGNVCEKNAACGMEICGEASPVLEGNECIANEAGFLWRGRGAGSARGNRALANRRNGCAAYEHARPDLTENTCEANGENGVAWFGDSLGTLLRNHAKHNDLHGVLVCERARPHVEANVCAGNLALDEMIVSEDVV